MRKPSQQKRSAAASARLANLYARVVASFTQNWLKGQNFRIVGLKLQIAVAGLLPLKRQVESLREDSDKDTYDILRTIAGLPREE